VLTTISWWSATRVLNNSSFDVIPDFCKVAAALFSGEFCGKGKNLVDLLLGVRFTIET
jgi:hypothetical protein